MTEVIDKVDKVVTDDMRRTLMLPYTEEDVRVALFQMHPSKSSGLDSMSPYFFQKFWHIVGPDVMSAVLSVLHSVLHLHKMNLVHIVLTPKKNKPEHMSEYRSISLANMVSKMVSKVMANWLKTILPNVISDAQSTFMPNRLITDNTIVALEMLHRMRNRRKWKIRHVKSCFTNMQFVGFYSVPNLIVILFNLLYPVFIVGFDCKGCVIERVCVKTEAVED